MPRCRFGVLLREIRPQNGMDADIDVLPIARLEKIQNLLVHSFVYERS